MLVSERVISKQNWLETVKHASAPGWFLHQLFSCYLLHFRCSNFKIRRPGSACTVFFSYVASKTCHKIQNPKSKIPKLQNPKSKIPKIQNPKSKIPKIQNPKSPKSPKSKIQNPPNLGRWGPHIKICYITVQNPKSKIPKIQNPKSPKSKIQNPKSPKSKIPKIQNPKSEIPKSKIQNPPNPKSPKSKIQNPRNLGPHKELLHNGPKSKIQNPQNRPKKFGFWILDLGDFGFWILGILVLLGRSRGCTTRQFGDGAWRSEARIPPGPPFRDSAKPTISDIVGARKQIELQKPGAQEVKTIFYTFLHDF